MRLPRHRSDDPFPGAPIEFYAGKGVRPEISAQHATVSLTRNNGDLRLAIEHDGDGFDPGAARSNGGLGLVSIEE